MRRGREKVKPANEREDGSMTTPHLLPTFSMSTCWAGSYKCGCATCPHENFFPAPSVLNSQSCPAPDDRFAPTCWSRSPNFTGQKVEETGLSYGTEERWTGDARLLLAWIFGGARPARTSHLKEDALMQSMINWTSIVLREKRKKILQWKYYLHL
jgi:hypothetical protein